MNVKRYLSTIFVYSKTLTKRFFRDKTALFFTLAFPLLFLVVFGGIFGGDTQPNFNVGLLNKSETEFALQFSDRLQKNPVFSVQEVQSITSARELVNQGELEVVVELPQSFGTLDQRQRPAGTLITHIDESDSQTAQTFNGVMQSILDDINSQFVTAQEPLKLTTQSLQTAGITQFDYVFAGLLGFSILSLGIFGMANGFPADKKAGILRRLRATPLRSSQIILSTAAYYLVVGVLSLLLMIIVGGLLFDFTMRGNWLIFSIFALISIISMFGFGLAIGGWAQNENQSQPISNLVAFPMMFLSGVFFPRFLMPDWLQSIAQFIPLSPIVDGFRFIITENHTLLDLGPELAIIGGWTVIIYTLAAYTFRWE